MSETFIPYTIDMKLGYHAPGDVYITYDEYSEGTIVNLRHVRTPNGDPWIGLGSNQTRQSLVDIGATVPSEHQGTHYGNLELIPETTTESVQVAPEKEPEPETTPSTKKEIIITVDGTVKMSLTIDASGSLDIQIKDKQD